MKHHLIKAISILLAVLLLSGCASHGVVQNVSKDAKCRTESYSIASHARLNKGGDNSISVLLAFSGGGSRAAALSYGVLKSLRDTPVIIDGSVHNLLDEVDVISSVSGGSFTAAYYGLYGEQIFSTFEPLFLNQDVENKLIRRLYDPQVWLGNKGRTEVAIEYFDETLFHGATFADMLRPDSPLILINTTDLGKGVRLSFIQEYFNLLCSDLSSFPISRAVAASSAVPLLFNPVVVENHSGCMADTPGWLIAAKQRFAEDSEMSLVTDGLETYIDKDKRKYIHLVDGGITDNLGLRAMYETIEIAGGPKALLAQLDRKPTRRIVFIVVDASTDVEPQMDKSTKEPTLEETVNAITDVQLHRYNAATLELMEQSLVRWSNELSTQKAVVTPYFIRLGFRDIKQPGQREFFNQIPTSLVLDRQQVDNLIKMGHELLHSNPVFNQLLEDLKTE